MPLQPGTRLGPYEIAAQIGVGGMGEVYQATDTKLKREVAIKVLPESVAADAERLARFQREAEVLAALNHPHIAAIYGLEDADGSKALVMELVEGPTLADRIADGAIPIDEALAIAKQIAEALEAAHEQGIIHRDLKPANVKVRDDGTVKVLDFGLAKAMAPAGAMSASASMSPTITTPAMTEMGMILGTAAYMSPEQARGRAVDKRADIWAFGVVLFEMLTGQRAFEGEDVSLTLAAVLRADVKLDALPVDTPARVRQVLTTCLQRDLKQRVPDIGAVRLALDGAFETRVLQTAESVAVPPRSMWRQALPLALGALVVGSLVSGIAVWSLRPAPDPSAVSRFSHLLPDGQQFTDTGRPAVAVSPDGSRLVYEANRQLYVRAMDALDSTPIPGTDETPSAPFFSPDGQWVGYWSAADGQLKKIAVSGGAPVTLCEAENPYYGPPTWGADDAIVWGQSEGIMRVSSNGGTPELLVDASDGILGEPQFLPDGQSLLFSSGSRIERQVVVQSLESGERKVLFAGGGPRYVSTGHIVYGLEDVLFAVPFDAGTLEVTGGPVPMVEGVQARPSQYAVSDAGTLAFVPGGGGVVPQTLALVNRAGQLERLTVPPAQYLTPRLSPDGEKLAVQTSDDDGNVLWVYDLSGDAQIQQLTFEGNNHRPVWTPDSQRLTFSSDRDGTMSLYWMPADGSGVAERLTTAEDGTSHWPGSWSPDGETLVFSVERTLATDWDIWTLSANGRETQSLYDTPDTIYFGPELSPDGQWLAYLAGPSSGESDIYVEPFPPTGARRRISQNGGFFPLWSPDGDELFYRPVSTSSEITLRSVDVETTPAFAFSNEQTLPIAGFTVVGYHRDYDMALDDERFVMVFPANERDGSEPDRSQIIVVLNWFEELKRRVPVR